MRHGNLTFGKIRSDAEWQDIKESWERLVNYDPYEGEWNE